jgi:hypothetical protein
MPGRSQVQADALNTQLFQVAVQAGSDVGGKAGSLEDIVR